ncbi:hypothetical protein AC578_8876 [Lecanosticta acicola]|uniref:Uncharacterized protein n=1 Tax=Lecanosticta acicola TaxID=111012 RepID=A0AAI8Z6I5_9PEZI|nr:hypothetical protein AC578_8876 [Lecanosticta acicola]
MRLPVLHSGLQSSSLQAQHVRRFVDGAAQGVHDITRTLVDRSSSSSDDTSSSSSSCTAGDTSSKCITPASVESSQNLAIILGVVIPLTCAAGVLFYLHRRHLKKQKLEDINDPHKSLDFGMDGVEPVSKGGKGKGNKVPEMSFTDLGGATSSRRGRGLSLDVGLGNNPYLLPAGLSGSKDSLHSMSRTIDEHDPYRPVTMMRDQDSARFGRQNDDKGSLYSMSTGHHSTMHDRAGLMINARPMSQSYGKRTDSFSPTDSVSSDKFSLRQTRSSPNQSLASRKASVDQHLPDIIEKEMFPLPPTPPEPVATQMPLPPRLDSTRASSNSVPPPPPRKDSLSGPRRPESSNYGDDEPPAPTNPGVTINEPEPYDIDPAVIYTRYSMDEPATQPMPALHAPQPVPAGSRLSVLGGPGGNRLSVMGMRPLPPDVPDDNPEVRANRIRSFYKEYFDDSKPTPAHAQYEDDGYDCALEGVIFDPDTGGFYAPGARPFAQDPGRRAMTPPPRARPRVSGNSSIAGPHMRKFSTYSMGGPRGRPPPKKNLPPPIPLVSLKTPHLLKDDSAIFNAADFAPPSTFRTMQNGSRPDSPMGTPRPYSPSVRAFTPLASSFENLSVLPSPHDLRKSGTFTALDFAPPSRLRDPAGSPTDTGSIRSNRSGISAMHQSALRDGAYRVSKIPKEMVTTKDDLANMLKPKMNLVSKA